MHKSFSLMLHGAAKVGKTTLADSGPAPRVVFDAENGNKWTGSRKVLWDPATQAPPVPDGTWDTCVVLVRSCDDLLKGSQWLQSGQHPFRSVTLDSVSEIQQRCMDSLVGESSMDQKTWGELLRMLSVRLRGFRDLTMHPTNPVEQVTFIAMSRSDKNGKVIPYVQGQLQTVLPYITDACIYLYSDVDQATGQIVRRGLTAMHPQFEAGDRTGRLPAVIEDPSIPQIFGFLYGEEPQQAPAIPAPLAHSVSVPETTTLAEAAVHAAEAHPGAAPQADGGEGDLPQIPLPVVESVPAA